MAKFKTIAKEVDAEQWTAKHLPAAVTQKAGVAEIGFVIGKDGKRREAHLTDFIVNEEGGSYPVSEGKFKDRYELAEKLPEIPAQASPSDTVPDTAPQSDAAVAPVSDGGVSGEVQG